MSEQDVIRILHEDDMIDEGDVGHYTHLNLRGGRQYMKKQHATKNLSIDFDALPDWLTPLEAGKFLRIGRTAIYSQIRSGELKARRFGRQFRIAKETLRPAP